ncbi:hypothetical protein MesoLjLc_61080 [Mesorhizobium sp. L-8-10]|uniref:hypothetical protein n=1 Tax=Mesorhizobium sp. L-8-10 TaxID=2744523 RepID=UPI00192912D3|nr:hypothetical protein [Mesorhizobium sp. L-8-10]BCH34178.1 hypothetical protein MesoLjLc_61080 [Mesorhizobium sp. L-8-10]
MRDRTMRVMVPALVALALFFSGTAFAIDITVQGTTNQFRQSEIDALRSIQNRQQFQLEQQWQRQQDRDMLSRPRPRPEVPQFAPDCRDPGTGSGNRQQRPRC